MKPHLLYRSRQANGWTRIDMLLSIYDAVIRAIDQGIASTMHVENQVPAPVTLQTQKLLLLLLEGIDPKGGQLTESATQLLVYCIERVQTGQPREWMTARKVLSGLREAFQEIREEARGLEEVGAIPRLDWSGSTAELALA